MELERVKTSSIFSYEDYNLRKSLVESIERNISALNLCIDSLNEERKLVGLKEEQNTVNPMSWNIWQLIIFAIMTFSSEYEINSEPFLKSALNLL